MPDKKDDPVLKSLLILAWPIILAFLFQNSYNMVDIFWVGRLGATAIAAVSLAGNIFYVILAVGQMIGSGTVALVAHSFGAGMVDRANSITKQSLLIASIIAFLVCVLGMVSAKSIMFFLGGRGEILALSTAYLRIVMLGFFFQLLTFSINYAFRGVGDMVLPMISMLVATGVNLVLDPLLILGFWVFPRLEVQGAAIATAVAQGAGFLIGFVILLKGRSGIRLHLKEKWHLEQAIVGRIFKVGVPVGISYGLMATSIMVVFGIVATFSKHALAALGIGTRIFQFASLPVVGIGIATTTLVGQSLGARDSKRATKVSNTALIVSILIMVTFGIAFVIYARPLIGIFTNDGLVIDQGVRFMTIVAAYLLFVGITTSMTGVFRGAGYTLPPMFTGLLKVGLLYTLAQVLSQTLELGIDGVWWSMIIAYAIESAILFLWYRRRSWRKKGLELLEGLSRQ